MFRKEHKQSYWDIPAKCQDITGRAAHEVVISGRQPVAPPPTEKQTWEIRLPRLALG